MQDLSKDLWRLLEPEAERLELTVIRERLVNLLLIAFAALGVAPVIFAAVSAFRSGQVGYGLAYLSFYLAFTLGAFFFWRKPLKYRGGLLLVLGTGLSILVLMRLGMSGIGVELLITFTVIAAIVFGPRVGLVMLAIGIVMIAVVALAYLTEVIVVEDASLLTSRQALPWIATGLVFALMAIVISIGPQLFRVQLIRALKREGLRADELEQAIGRLHGEIGQRKRAEAAQKESETRFQELVQLLPVTVFETNAAGNFAFVNPCGFETFGYQPEDLDSGVAILDMLDPKDHARAMHHIAQINEGKSTPLKEYTAVRKDGSTFPMLIRSSPLYRSGEIVGVRGIIVDITDQKRLEAQFQQAQKMEAVGTLAGGIAHDFNNLLMGIQGRTSLLLAELGEYSPHHSQLEFIEEYVESASDLTQQLLGLARGGKYETRPTDLNKLAQKSIQMFARARKELTIETKFGEDLLTVEVDRHQIEQVMLNLLLNAWQAMPEGGAILVETANISLDAGEAAANGTIPGRFSRISVTDTGCGIEHDALPHIFEPFFTTKEKTRGSGLGLASAYGIVKNHNGAFVVDSEVGRGSTFHVYLPGSMAIPAKDRGPISPLVGGDETILIVDDEAFVVEIGGEMLKSLGYNVMTALSGKEALKLVKSKPDEIELVILDMVMPNMSGADTFFAMREVAPDLKVLLSSGYSVEEDAASLLENGAAGFLKKPYSLFGFSKKLREVVGVD